MEGKIATLIGASGLTGSCLLEMLVSDEYYAGVRVLSRRPLEISSPATEVRIVDFSDYESLLASVRGSDSLFCAVGTTNNKVGGDREAYRKVDFDIPVMAARACSESGCSSFVVISSVGADSSSNNFYLRLKGEMEKAVEKETLPSAVVMRPSMLLGKRREFRFGEVVGKVLAATLSFVFPAKYKPVKASVVAAAMVAAAKRHEKGFQILHNTEIKMLAGKQDHSLT